MSRWSVTVDSFLPVPVANGANFTDLGYCAIQGAAAVHAIRIADILVTGLETATATTPLKLARSGVLGATGLSSVGMNIAEFDPEAQALPNMPVLLNASTVKPQRHATKHLLNLGFNAWGGALHWAALDPTEVIKMMGNIPPWGEVSISCMTGGGTPGKVSATIQLELE